MIQESERDRSSTCNKTKASNDLYMLDKKVKDEVSGERKVVSVHQAG